MTEPKPIQLQDSKAAPEWTCRACGGDALFCKCIPPTKRDEAMPSPHIDAVNYARHYVVPLYFHNQEGTPYERGMIRQIAAHWLAGYFAARPPTVDEPERAREDPVRPYGYADGDA